jgi:acyl carrier protein
MDKKETALQVLARLSEVETSELQPEMELVADLGIDSPKALELLVDLEEALKIEISDEQAAAMETVGDVLQFVEQLA